MVINNTWKVCAKTAVTTSVSFSWNRSLNSSKRTTQTRSHSRNFLPQCPCPPSTSADFFQRWLTRHLWITWTVRESNRPAASWPLLVIPSRRSHTGTDLMIWVILSGLLRNIRVLRPGSIKSNKLVQWKLSICYIDVGWFSHMQGGGMRRSGGYGDWRQRSIWKIRQVNMAVT